jgi:predicted hydrocarbon binding protein
MKGKKYEPTRSNRFYPGRISEERARQVERFEISVDEVTVDDIVYNVSRAMTRMMYGPLAIIELRWGKQAAIEVAQELAYMLGKASYGQFLASRGRKSGTPELMSMYQDLIHALLGPAGSTSFTTYDEEKCVVVRTQCPFHTGRPEGMEGYCKYTGEGFMKGYTEVDPAFIETEQPFCLARGDDHCERTFKFKRT